MPNAGLCIPEMYYRWLQSFQCLVVAFIFSQQFAQMTEPCTYGMLAASACVCLGQFCCYCFTFC